MTNHDEQPLYFDHNATTPVHPAVVEEMLPYLREHHGNPSSSHAFGRRAHEAIESGRERVARLIGCNPDEIIFTSGGTEANNLAIRGLVESAELKRGHLVTSIVEHPAIAMPCGYLERHGFAVTRLPVDETGRTRLEEARASIRDDTLLVTVMLAQNETGTLMPVRELAALAHERGVVMHTDAAQAVGKISVDVDDLSVDMLSIAGHKLYAPKGVGALYVRRGTTLAPLILGAGHERGLRPGTENVASIVGLGTACELAGRDLDTETDRQRRLCDGLWDRLLASIPGLRLNSHPTARLPNTLNVSFPGVKGSHILAAAPGIAASTGSACHEGGELPSVVLIAQGLESDVALGAVRLSIGRSTTLADIEFAAHSLIDAFRQVSRD